MKMKKIVLVVSMLAVMLSLAGCGKEAEKGFDYDEKELTLLAMDYFMYYASVDDDYYDYYQEAGTNFEKSAIKGIDQALNNDKVGSFENYNKYIYNSGTFNPESVDASFTEGDGTVTVTVVNEAKNRDVEISVQFSENPEYFMTYAELDAYYTDEVLESLVAYNTGYDLESFLAISGYGTAANLKATLIDDELTNQEIDKYIPEEMVVSPVYSKGELMKQAGLNTAIGMGTVFVVLIFISFIISLFKFLPAITAKKAKVPEPKQEPQVKKAAPVVKKEENLMKDSELVAVITAAVYAAASAGGLATSKDGLVVRSIKRAKK